MPTATSSFLMNGILCSGITVLLYHHRIHSKMIDMPDHISIRFDHCGIDADTLASTAQGLQTYVANLQATLGTMSYEDPASFLLLPEDHDLINRIIDVATEKESPNIQGVIVVGIGGSSQGTMALAQALQPRREILFLETADPAALHQIGKKLHAASGQNKYYITILVSKSGITIESVANFGALLPVLESADAEWTNHIIVITDEGTPAWRYAEQQHFSRIAIPAGVGGRFSVLSPVGLLPLLIAGVPTTHILEGAAKMKALCLTTTSLEQNPALMGAAAQYIQLQQGKGIHNLFVFAPHLEMLGKWWRQLVGESLGKQGKGVIPMVSVGSTDLHSMGQLYFDGPPTIFTTLVGISEFSLEVPIPAGQGLAALAPSIEGKELGRVLQTIYHGTRAAYQHTGLPFIDVELGKTSPENLGAFLQWKMMETIYLARLMSVDPFNQPAVASYKDETAKLLQEL